VQGFFKIQIIDKQWLENGKQDSQSGVGLFILNQLSGVENQISHCQDCIRVMHCFNVGVAINCVIEVIQIFEG
jgi:hypothetical protein